MTREEAIELLLKEKGTIYFSTDPMDHVILVNFILEKLTIAEEALDKLQRLGNEPHIGNSIGNDIARTALSSIRGHKNTE